MLKYTHTLLNVPISENGTLFVACANILRDHFTSFFEFTLDFSRPVPR
jgi:hypothetical protein